MKSYPYLDKLDAFYHDLLLRACERLLATCRPHHFPRIRVVDRWLDDSLPCIDVRMEVEGHTIKFSLWNYSEESVAAFYYPDSPTAQKVILDIIKLELTRG